MTSAPAPATKPRPRSRTVWVPSIHPFKDDLSIDEEAFRAHLRRLADAGLNVLVANEGTGESFTFSRAEMELVCGIAADELNGRVPVRGMGRMVRTAGEMIDFVQLVKASGLRGVQIYALDLGHGFRPTPAEQEGYLRAVLDQCDVETVLSIHEAAGYEYSVDMLDRLVDDYPNLVGTIVTTADVHYLWRLVDALADRIEIHTHTYNAMTNLALGGDGYASPEANLAPQLCADVMDQYAAGDYAAAERSFAQVMDLWHIVGKYGATRGTKAALNLLGYGVGSVRPPRLPCTEADIAEIAERLSRSAVPELRRAWDAARVPS